MNILMCWMPPTHHINQSRCHTRIASVGDPINESSICRSYPICPLPTRRSPVLFCQFIQLGHPTILYISLPVFWGLALCPARYPFEVRYGTKCGSSTSVCDSSPLVAVSFSDQLVPAPCHSWCDLCMRSSYFSSTIAYRKLLMEMTMLTAHMT